MGPKSQSHPASHSLFSFFLSSPPPLSSPLFFLSLFFFIYSSFYSSLEQKTHTHQPLTCTTFFLLSSNSVFFLFFLFCSSPISHSHTDPHPPKPRDHRRRSSITHRKTPPRICSPHRCYRNHSSIWPKRQNQHPQQRSSRHPQQQSGRSVELTSTTTIWPKRQNRHPQQRFNLEALLLALGTASLEARFLSGSSFFLFFLSWCIINKYEWSFEFGVMSCFRWC